MQPSVLRSTSTSSASSCKPTRKPLAVPRFGSLQARKRAQCYSWHNSLAQGARVAAAGAAEAAAAYLPDEQGKDPLTVHPPLLNKRIIVTAPRQYAQKLCAKLLNAGARPLWVPGVSITYLDPRQHTTELQQLDAALKKLMSSGHGYTHIAFTSKNGICAVLQRLAHLAGGLEAGCEVLRGCGARLCALGADGQVLLQAGLPVHVSPPEASTQGLVRALESQGEARGAKVLCPVPLVTGGLTEPPVVPRFLAALEAAGARPERVPAYVTTQGCTPQECEAERQLLLGGHVHAIAFSSTAEAQGLVQAVGGLDLLTQAVQQNHVLLAAHGPYTAQGASQVLGMPVPCVSSNFTTFDGLVTALEAALADDSSCSSSHQSNGSTGGGAHSGTSSVSMLRTVAAAGPK